MGPTDGSNEEGEGHHDGDRRQTRVISVMPAADGLHRDLQPDASLASVNGDEEDASPSPSVVQLATLDDGEEKTVVYVVEAVSTESHRTSLHPERVYMPLNAILHIHLIPAPFAAVYPTNRVDDTDKAVEATFAACDDDDPYPLSLSPDVLWALEGAALRTAKCDDRHEGDVNTTVMLQFTEEGVYTFRLQPDRHVVVTVTNDAVPRRLHFLGLKVFLGVAVAVGFIVGAIFAIEFVLGNLIDGAVKGDLRGGAYVGVAAIVKIAKEQALPWIVASLVVFFLLIVCLLLYCCCPTTRTFGAMYGPRLQVGSQGATMFLAAAAAGMVLALWAVFLASNVGLADVFRVVTLGVTNALNQALGTFTALQYLIVQLPVILPSITVPPSASQILKQVQGIAVSVQTVASNGDAIVEAILQAESVLQFCALQVVIFSAALLLVAAKRRSSRPMFSAAFFSGLSLSLVLFAVGITSLANGIFEQTYTISNAFNDKNLTTTGLQQSLDISVDSPLMQVFSFCAANGTLSPAYLKNVMNTLVEGYNEQAANTSLPQLDTVSGNNVNDLLLNGLYLSQQLDAISARAAADPDSFKALLPFLNGETVPFLHATITTVRSMSDLINCQVVRDVVAETLPVMKTELIDRYAIQLGLYYTLIALLAVSIVVAVIASYVFHYPTHEASEGYRNNQALPALMSVPSALAGTYTFHNTNAISLSSQAAMLLIAHVSADANRLSPLLQVVAFVCVVVPLIVLLDMLCTSHAALRVMLRVLMMLICVVGVVLCIISANDDGTTFSSCVGSLTFAAGNTTSGNISYPYNSTCTADKVLKQAQGVVYSCVVGLTCLFGFATSLVLVFVPRYNPFANLLAMTRRAPTPDPSSLEPDADVSTSVETDKRENQQTCAELVIAFVMVVIALIGSLLLGLAFAGSLGASTVAAPRPSATSTSYTFAVDPSVDPDTCNGYRGICDVPIHRVIWPGTHNSFSTQEDGFVTPNHFYTYSRQLKAGFRAFMIDVWQKDTDPYQPYHCHEICALGNFPMLRLLTETKAFLDANPREVVILMLEQYFHTPNMTVAFERANLTQLLWAPANQSDSPQNNPWFVWPTLRQLIAQNKRLLVSTDTRQGTVVNPDPVPVWLTYSWDYQFEDPYSHESVDDLDCRYNRGYTTDNATMRNKMPTFNHYLTAPLATPGLASAANAPEVLRAHVERCKAAWGVLPSLIAVDYWDVQEPLRTLSALQTQYVAKS